MRLYTRTVCAACTGVKESLRRSGTDFTEVNIEKDHDAAWDLVNRGFRTVPVLEKDGEFLSGDALREFADAA